MNTAKMQRVFARVLKERERQDRLKEQGRFIFTCADTPGLIPSEKYTVLGEEVGEVARVILNLANLTTDFDFLSSPVDVERSGGRDALLNRKLQRELTEVAAVACAWLESMELEPVEGIQR